MQIAHAGRKASSEVPWRGGQQIPVDQGGWVAHAPSAVPQKEGETPPKALDRAGLARLRAAFVATAERAARLGLDGIELHAAHGYLLHEFLSPIANHRIDEYGGSLENRLRFPLEVFDAVRAAFPSDKPVGVKVSATDWVDGGWDVEQTIAFASELQKRGVDWIDVSSGGVSPLQRITLGPGYQVPFAQAVKEATGVNDHRRGSHHRGARRPRPSSPAARPISWRWPVACSTTRAGPGMPRPSSAPRSMHHRNTGARRRTSRRTCSARPCSVAAEHYFAGRESPMTRLPEAAAPFHWAPIYWLALGTFAVGTEGFMIAAILPGIATDLTVSVQAAGQLMAIFALTYALSSPVLTALTGGFDRRRLLILSMAAFAAANLVAAVAPGYWALVAARVCWRSRPASMCRVRMRWRRH